VLLSRLCSLPPRCSHNLSFRILLNCPVPEGAEKRGSGICSGEHSSQQADFKGVIQLTYRVCRVAGRRGLGLRRRWQIPLFGNRPGHGLGLLDNMVRIASDVLHMQVHYFPPQAKVDETLPTRWPVLQRRRQNHFLYSLLQEFRQRHYPILQIVIPLVTELKRMPRFLTPAEQEFPSSRSVVVAWASIVRR
jgi:hypothetical protein